MALTASNKSAWHAIGDRIAVITLWVNKTFSETGQVRLAAADWRRSRWWTSTCCPTTATCAADPRVSPDRGTA